MNAIIALNPQQMQDSKSTTLGWVKHRIETARRELALAEQVFNSLQAHKLRTQPASAQIRKARVRIAFYEKVKAALDAGYYIIPPFDVQLFAIRTNHAAPPDDRGSRTWESEEKARSLSVGEGRYVNPTPVRKCVGQDAKTDTDGKRTYVDIYENTEFRDVDLPIRAMKPEIIEATGRAVSQKIFDALGIAPAYRSADPIIVGQIKRPAGGVLTFFVAWWLDEADL